MSRDSTQSSAPASVEALWDEALLTRAAGALEWDRLEALAEALSAEHGGWCRVVEVFERSIVSPDWRSDSGWVRCPYFLTAVGLRGDDALRCEIAEYFIEVLEDLEVDDDYLIEVLTESIGLLGPCVLPEVAKGLARITPDDAGWFSLQHLQELACGADATAGQRAVAIESAERLLRRELAGEIEPGMAEFSSWTLALLGHEPSVGLIDEASRRYKSARRARYLGNEHAFALKHLKGEDNVDDSRNTQPWSKPIGELAEQSWQSYLSMVMRDEEARRSDFDSAIADLDAVPSFAERMKDYVAGHDQDGTFRPAVSRNAKCPCGSGRKYKNCCADR